MPKGAPHHTLLGFDFGMRRIGVAVGQTITQTATPLAVLQAQDGVPHWESIKELITTWNIDGLVVGIPYSMDGSEQPMTYAAHQFAKKLFSRFKLPVYTTDERLTTVETKRHQRAAEKQSALAFSELDSHAAKLILEQWLREKAHWDAYHA